MALSTPPLTAAAPPPASPDLTLSLVSFPKLEPKPEPLDEPIPGPAIGPPGPLDPLLPGRHIPESEDGEAAALLSEYLRLAQLYAAAAANQNRSLIPLPQREPLPPAAADPQGTQSSSSAIVVAKKRKARSAEMVRVTSLDFRDQVYYRDRTRRTRITYESLRTLLIREEVSKGEASAVKRTRPDLKAATLMGDRDLWLNRDKRIIGSIPGISVGDVFFFRMELCVLGLHGHIQAGIDYVAASRTTSGEPIATSIIVSGGYEDDDDKGLMLIYTGAGGREQNMHKQSMNQKLEGGNLALERSMNYGIEIRVIRGVKYDRSPIGRVYVYDGLYKVVECWMDIGKSGFSVYKYKLLRIQGQEEMGSDTLKFAEQLKVNPMSVRPRGYLSLDISKGRENFRVGLFNDIDDDQEPLLFEYLARPIYPAEALQGKANADIGRGCECILNCSASCFCSERNGAEFPYDPNGVLLRGKPLVYECGPSCRCPPSCPNRVSQKGLRYRLEIFRSRETGWGVRSLDLIRAGTFICELSGVVLNKQQTDNADGYSLVHPGQFPGRWLEWGDVSDVLPDYVPADFPSLPDINFSLDVSRARNVACYISHSCNPNVFAQFVLFDHYNVSYPHIMIFALENIPPLRELSIDYGIRDEWIGKLTM